MWEAIIPAAASIIGGLMRDSSNENVAESNQAMQREFAQHGIRWRVEDAKEAGVHPLYALGSGVTPYTPQALVGSGLGEGLASMGQNVGRAIAAQQTGAEREEQALKLKLLAAQIDESDARAQMYRSQALRPQAGANALPTPGVGYQVEASEGGAQSTPYKAVADPVAYQLPAPYEAGYPGKFDTFKPKYPEIESANPNAPWSSAGPARPGLQPFRLTRYLELLLPMNDEGWTEGLESLPYSMYPMVYQANVDRYGKDIWRVIVQELGARSRFAQWVASLGMENRTQWDWHRSPRAPIPSRNILPSLGGPRR